MAYIFDPTKRNTWEQVQKNADDIKDLRAIVDGIDVQSSWVSSEDYTTQQAYYDLEKITGAIQDVKVGEHVYFVSSEIDAIISWIGNNQYQVTNATSRRGVGTPALEYYGKLEKTVNPAINQAIGLNKYLFNRTPVSNDTCLVAYKNTTTGHSWIINAHTENGLTNDNLQNVDFLVKNFTETTGEQGAQGEKGVSIERVENVGTSQGQGFTITHCEATLSNGETETFDVQAQNGASGVAKYINITAVPDTTTSGTLTAEELATLNEDPQNNYIMFYGEKFIPMDIKDANGYRVYTHHGETDGTKQEVSKFIYLTLSTGGWVMNINTALKLYVHTLRITFTYDEAAVPRGECYTQIICTKPNEFMDIHDIFDYFPNLVVNGAFEIEQVESGSGTIAYLDIVGAGQFRVGYVLNNNPALLYKTYAYTNYTFTIVDTVIPVP